MTQCTTFQGRCLYICQRARERENCLEHYNMHEKGHIELDKETRDTYPLAKVHLCSMRYRDIHLVIE